MVLSIRRQRVLEVCTAVVRVHGRVWQAVASRVVNFVSCVQLRMALWRDDRIDRSWMGFALPPGFSRRLPGFPHCDLLSTVDLRRLGFTLPGLLFSNQLRMSKAQPVLCGLAPQLCFLRCAAPQSCVKWVSGKGADKWRLRSLPHRARRRGRPQWQLQRFAHRDGTLLLETLHADLLLNSNLERLCALPSFRVHLRRPATRLSRR